MGENGIMDRKIRIEYRVYKNPEALAQAAAAYLIEAVKGKTNIAVSGGSTPKNTLTLLSDATPSIWKEMKLFFVDERLVPPDDPESNYKMVKEALLDKVPLSAEQVVRIAGELPPEEAALQYENEIRARFNLQTGGLPSFDIIQLGMGDDGHTASLFPHTKALDIEDRIAVANHIPEKDTWRVTLTKSVINNAADVFFLISGKDKAEPLQRGLMGCYDPGTLPVQLIAPKSGRLLFLLDKDAAALLPAPNADGVGKVIKNNYIGSIL